MGESHCEKGIRVHGRREIRWTRMRTLLCPERAYTVGTLMSARMKAWALLCLLLAKLPQQVAYSAGSPHHSRTTVPGFYLSLSNLPSPLSFLLSRIAKKHKSVNGKEFRHSISKLNLKGFHPKASLFYIPTTDIQETRRREKISQNRKLLEITLYPSKNYFNDH